MARTRTQGITIDCNGALAINKEYRGRRLFVRLGHVSQEDADARLQLELERLDVELECRSHRRPLFRNCAARYLYLSGSPELMREAMRRLEKRWEDRP